MQPPIDTIAGSSSTLESTQMDQAEIMNQIQKWGYPFDGKNPDPENFLERMEELRHIYNISDRLLLLGLPLLLRDDSLAWYRNNRGTWTDWAGFCRDFRTHFLPWGYARQLRRTIQDRQQKPNEPFSKYATELLTLMRRAKYSHQEQIEQLYESWLQAVYSLGKFYQPELTIRATKYEEIQRRKREWQQGAKQTAEAMSASYSREDCCWRCKQRGHTRDNCRQPFKKFCSRCCKAGVFTRDCRPSTRKD